MKTLIVHVLWVSGLQSQRGQWSNLESLSQGLKPSTGLGPNCGCVLVRDSLTARALQILGHPPPQLLELPFLLFFVHNPVTQGSLQTMGGTGIPREMGRTSPTCTPIFPLLSPHYTIHFKRRTCHSSSWHIPQTFSITHFADIADGFSSTMLLLLGQPTGAAKASTPREDPRQRMSA
jgi:hypothetical protein